MNFTFEQTLSGLTAEEFAATYWGEKPLWGHLPRDFLDLIKNDLGGLEPTNLIARHSGTKQTWFEDDDGRLNNMDVSAEQAIKLYGAAQTVYLGRIEIPSLAQWEQSFSDAVGFRASKLRRSLFLSKGAAGTRPHFDHFENFTIQLCGSKQWHISPNMHVTNPTHNYVTNNSVNGWRKFYMPTHMPTYMPGKVTSVVMEAGMFLYLPRGYWHSTDKSDNSLSLFMGIQTTPWADVVLDSVRALLIKEEEWRENAVGNLDMMIWQQKGREELAIMLEDIKKKISVLTPDCIYPSLRYTKGGGTYRINPIATFAYLVSAGKVKVDLEFYRGLLSSKSSYDLPQSSAAILDTILSADNIDPTSGVFSIFNKDDVHQVIRVLAEAGYLLQKE